MTIKEICEEIKDIYFREEHDKDDIIKIMRLVDKARRVFDEEDISSKKLQYFLDIELEIAKSKKPLKQKTEKQLLNFITYVPYQVYDNEIIMLPNQSSHLKEDEIIANQLIAFAKDLMAVKVSRDAFTGKRKGYAIDLLGNIAAFYEIEEFVEICKNSLKEKSKQLFYDTIESLKEYYEQRDQFPDDEIIKILDKRFSKAKNRTEATGCLVFQVDTGVIDEFEALSRLGEWKRKNPYR